MSRAPTSDADSPAEFSAARHVDNALPHFPDNFAIDPALAGDGLDTFMAPVS